MFDADGWGWASVKAFFWLLVLIIVLGYVPDRAYYFVVSRTIDLGILGWSPVNLCPPENGADMPCPVPKGAVLPWSASTSALPAARSNGAAIQLGTNVLFVGGTAGDAASAQVDLAELTDGKLGAWSQGPAIPEARADAAVATLSGTAYLLGGLGPDGGPTTSVWSIGLDPDTSELAGAWAEVEGVALPEARSGAAAVAVSDGIVVIGGRNAEGAPTNTVWKSTLDKDGKLGTFEPQANLVNPVADAVAALEGTFIWVLGGSDANGPSAAVQRASYGDLPAAGPSAEPGEPGGEATPAASGAPQGVAQWAVREGVNLPGPRTSAAGFAANGALYVVGGSDAEGEQTELYWAIPNADGDLPGGWRTLDKINLPSGIADAGVIVSGSTVFLVGGTGPDGQLGTTTSTSLAPQEPFFQLGIAGLVVPGLQIGGEIGQQLGYLAAAGVGTGNFVILVIVAWAFNNREKISGFRERRRIAQEAKVPPEAAT